MALNRSFLHKENLNPNLLHFFRISGSFMKFRTMSSFSCGYFSKSLLSRDLMQHIVYFIGK